MGKWYVVEILEHKPIPEQEIGSKLVIDRCPIIRLRFDERGLIRLLWSEEKGQLEYTFSLPNSKISGVWNSAAKQNGIFYVLLHQLRNYFNCNYIEFK